MVSAFSIVRCRFQQGRDYPLRELEVSMFSAFLKVSDHNTPVAGLRCPPELWTPTKVYERMHKPVCSTKSEQRLGTYANSFDHLSRNGIATRFLVYNVL